MLSCEWILRSAKVLNHEFAIGIFRSGKEHKKFGDKFETAMVVIRFGTELFIKGASGKFDRELWKNIYEFAEKEGAKNVWFERRGNWKKVEILEGK